MIVKDAMILIHLGKITLLETCCDYFKEVIISKMVHEESTRSKNHSETRLISELVDKKKIKVKNINKKNFIIRANNYNIQRGEAESLALYWQENAKYLATDDNNVRKKRDILNINIIGTPAIILKLYKEKLINEIKFKQSLQELKKIGWFNNTIIDKLIMEIE